MESIVQQLRRRPIVALRHFLMDLSSAGDFFRFHKLRRCNSWLSEAELLKIQILKPRNQQVGSFELFWNVDLWASWVWKWVNCQCLIVFQLKKDWGILKWSLSEPGNWMNRSDVNLFNMENFCFAWSWMTSSRCQWLSLVQSHHFAKVADFQLRPWCWLKESDISGFLNRIDAGQFQGFPSKFAFFGLNLSSWWVSCILIHLVWLNLFSSQLNLFDNHGASNHSTEPNRSIHEYSDIFLAVCKPSCIHFFFWILCERSYIWHRLRLDSCCLSSLPPK